MAGDLLAQQDVVVGGTLQAARRAHHLGLVASKSRDIKSAQRGDTDLSVELAADGRAELVRYIMPGRFLEPVGEPVAGVHACCGKGGLHIEVNVPLQSNTCTGSVKPKDNGLVSDQCKLPRDEAKLLRLFP